MNWKWVRSAATVLLLPFLFQACDSLEGIEDLEVINENAPDTERALATPGDIESLIGSAFQVWHSGSHWSSPSWLLSSAGDEGSLSWGNFGIRDASSEPRPKFNNASSYAYAAAAEVPWYTNYQALSAVYDGIRAIQADPVISDAINDDRALAFAKLIQGLTHGWLALMFDSAFVFDETVDLEVDVLELQPYPNVMAAALGFLDEAISRSSGAGWQLPSSWINGNEFSGSELAQVANGYAARFLSQVGRTPADRAAQDWNRILSYANNGVTEDFWVEGDGADQWFKSLEWYGGQVGRTWARADYRTIGATEAGQGKGYDNWLATPVALRQPFDLDVPDRRITPGPPPHVEFETDGLDFGHWGQPNHPEARGTYHWSFYGHHRYEDYPATGGLAPNRFMSVDEMNLIKAEALIRLGQSGAAALINNTRVARGQLPPVSDADPNLMQSLMYEATVENFFLCPGCAHFNRRGWGAVPVAPSSPVAPNGATHHYGLIEGTQLHWAIPGAELEILQKVNYSYGGAGEEGAALQPSASSPFGDAVNGVPARRVYQLGEFDSPKAKLEFFRSRRATPEGVSSLSRYH